MLEECRIITDAIESAVKNLDNKGGIIGIGADGQPTSLIDKVAEDAAIEKIRELELRCQVLSEEAGLVKIVDDPEYTLILDPIDGTYNAINGIPYYGISIAVFQDNEITFGYVKNIPNGDVFYADKKAYCNGKVIRTSNVKKFSDAFVCISRPACEESYKRYKNIFLNSQKLRIFGAVALDICYLAGGSFDVFVDMKFGLKTVDLAASKHILEKAGGTMRTLDNQEYNVDFDLTKRPRIVAAANQKLLKEVFKLI